MRRFRCGGSGGSDGVRLVHELLMHVPGQFRVVPSGSGWCRVAPGGSEWFRTICVESHSFSCFSFLASLPKFSFLAYLALKVSQDGEHVEHSCPTQHSWSARIPGAGRSFGKVRA